MPRENFATLPLAQKQRIVEAVIDEVLDAGGRRSLTFAGVARRLDMDVSWLQDWFPGEEDLLDYTTNFVVRFWEERISADISLPLLNGWPTERALAAGFHQAMGWAREHQRYARFDMMLFYELDLNHPLRQKYRSGGLGRLLKLMHQVIQRGQARGEVRADLHPRVTAFWAASMMYFLMDASISPLLDEGLGVQGEESCGVINATLDLLLRGLEPLPMMETPDN
ncbi:MAG: hypothetical protein C4524_11940 [Candidatus Zixiibacteriota bacterium]|nr:MAG: hypothetical protein C4524_11940 [candidate division Zixibacteria bacterium]